MKNSQAWKATTVLLAAMLVSACSGNSNNNNGDEASPTAAAQSSAPASPQHTAGAAGAQTETERIAAEIAAKYQAMNLSPINDGKPVKIRVHLGDIIPTLSETPTAEQPMVFNSTRILKTAFEMIYPNVEIEWVRNVDTTSADSFLMYMTTQLSSGSAPDIVSAWGAAFAANNWFYDFNEVLDEPNPYVAGSTAWRNQFPAYFFSSWNVSDAKGRVAAIPLSAAPGTSTALYYNKDLFEELELTPPRTWEEMFVVGQTLTDNDYVSLAPWGAPGSGNRKVSTNIWDVQMSLGPYYAAAQRGKLDYNGDDMLGQDEKLRAAYEGHFFIESNDYAQDMWKQVKRKYSVLLQEGYENTDYESKWLLGKVGLLEDGLWRYPAELSDTEREYEFDLIPPPVITPESSSFVEQAEFTEKGPSRPPVAASYNIMLPSIEKHGEGTLEASVRFLQFLTEPANNDMIILEQQGKSVGFQSGQSIPPELAQYFDQSFPKVPAFEWPGGFTNEGNEKMNKALELWVAGQLSDEQFYVQFDTEFKKDIEKFIEALDVDTSGWTRAW